MKTCTKCLLEKEDSEFYIEPRSGKLRSRCKKCSSLKADGTLPKQVYKLTDSRRASKKKWLEANRQSRREWEREYSKRPSSRARRKRWMDENPEKVRWAQRRRAAKAKAEGTHTYEEFLAVCTLYGGVCLACGVSGPLTEDHVVPLSKGGSDNIDNIQPLCKSCNSKKHVKIVDYRTEAEVWEMAESS